MNKSTWLVIIVVVAAAFAIYELNISQQNALQAQNNPSVNFDPLNAPYTIDSQTITLVNGKAETEAAPGSATKIITMIFGEPIRGDLNGDGKTDAALMLMQNPGGSGTFYYIAAALNTDTGARGTNAILLGDRVAPQNVEIKNGQVIANYTERKPDEPMTAQPSIGVSKYVNINGLTLTEAPRVAGPGEPCGGNMTTAPVCESGYHCAPRQGSHLPFGDVGGTCVAD